MRRVCICQAMPRAEIQTIFFAPNELIALAQFLKKAAAMLRKWIGVEVSLLELLAQQYDKANRNIAARNAQTEFYFCLTHLH